MRRVLIVRPPNSTSSLYRNIDKHFNDIKRSGWSEFSDVHVIDAKGLDRALPQLRSVDAVVLEYDFLDQKGDKPGDKELFARFIASQLPDYMVVVTGPSTASQEDWLGVSYHPSSQQGQINYAIDDILRENAGTYTPAENIRTFYILGKVSHNETNELARQFHPYRDKFNFIFYQDPAELEGKPAHNAVVLLKRGETPVEIKNDMKAEVYLSDTLHSEDLAGILFRWHPEPMDKLLKQLPFILQPVADPNAWRSALQEDQKTKYG